MDDHKIDDIPLIYLYIYKKLAENTKRFKVLPYRVLISEFSQKILPRRIPRKYFDVVIKELIDLKLIEKVSGGRSSIYNLTHEDYEKRINELKKIEKSGLRFKIVRDKYEKLLKDIEKEEGLAQKYKLLKCNYEVLLRKLELKKLEGSHYW